MTHTISTIVNRLCRAIPALVASTLFVALSSAQSLPEAQVQPASYDRTAPPSARQSVRFGRREPQVGDQLEQALSVAVQLDTLLRQGTTVVERSKSAMRREQRRTVTTTHVDHGMTVAVLVRYTQARKETAAGSSTGKLGESSLAPQSVEGKSYRCRRDGETLLVTDEAGKIPPLAESEIVTQNMETLGRPNPLADFLSGKTLTVGQQLAVPSEVAEKLLGLGGEMGGVTRFELTLANVIEIDGATCAEFRASIEAASNDSSQMRLVVEGPLVIQVDTCRAVAANFTGPIGMSETRGSLTATYQMAGTGNMTVSIASNYSDARR
jgi:hypothetical protein